METELECDEAEIARIRQLRRARAAQVNESFLDNDDWKNARQIREQRSLSDSVAFDLEEEETQGHYDSEGFFLFDNQQRSNDKRIIWGNKELRDQVERKLGIDDEEVFVEKKLRKVDKPQEKMMKVRSLKSLDNKEYSDDDGDVELSERLQTRDRWLDDVDQGNICWKSEEAKLKVLERKHKELEAQEERLRNRFGAAMTKKEKLHALISLLETPQQTAADLMRLIKERDCGVVDPRQKKGFQKSKKLSRSAQKQMDEVVEICDELALDGFEAISECREALQRALFMPEVDQSQNEQYFFQYRCDRGKSPVGPVTVTQLQTVLSLVEHDRRSRYEVREVSNAGDVVDGVWRNVETLDWNVLKKAA